jgi:hypothetical protein
MAAAATALLDEPAALSPSEREYALTAGILGFAASGRAEQGARLWAGNVAAPAASAALGPELRLMLSMAPAEAGSSAVR